MRKKILITIFLLNMFRVYGQNNEIYLGIGSSYYIGDLSPINNKNPLESSIQRHHSFLVGFRHQFKKLFSVGIEFSKIRISANDADNASFKKYDQSWYRLIRNLNFTSDIYQAFTTIRLEPLLNRDRWYNEKLFVSPYIGAGIGLFMHNPTTTYRGQTISLSDIQTEGIKYSLIQASIPLTGGLKIVGPKRKTAITFNFQYFLTFTDYLDDVSTNYVDPNTFFARFDPVTATMAADLANRSTVTGTTDAYITLPRQQRGNPKNNDYFFNSSVSISFLFGGAKRDGYSSCCYF